MLFFKTLKKGKILQSGKGGKLDFDHNFAILTILPKLSKTDLPFRFCKIELRNIYFWQKKWSFVVCCNSSEKPDHVPWTSHEPSMDLPWSVDLWWTYHGPPVDLQWTSHGPSMDLQWTYHGPPLTSCRPLMDLPWTPVDILWTSREPPMNLLWTSYGPPMDLLWTSHLDLPGHGPPVNLPWTSTSHGRGWSNNYDGRVL